MIIMAPVFLLVATQHNICKYAFDILKTNVINIQGLKRKKK